MSLYRETPCEHGRVERHGDMPYEDFEKYEGSICPGGSREEVTIDYEAWLCIESPGSISNKPGSSHHCYFTGSQHHLPGCGKFLLVAAGLTLGDTQQ